MEQIRPCRVVLECLQTACSSVVHRPSRCTLQEAGLIRLQLELVGLQMPVGSIRRLTQAEKIHLPMQAAMIHHHLADSILQMQVGMFRLQMVRSTLLLMEEQACHQRAVDQAVTCSLAGRLLPQRIPEVMEVPASQAARLVALVLVVSEPVVLAYPHGPRSRMAL